MFLDVASHSLDNISVSASSEYGKSRMENCQLTKSILNCISSKSPLKSVEPNNPLECQPEVFCRGEEADKDVSKDSPILSENDNVRRNQQTEEDQDKMDEEKTAMKKEEISQRSIEHVQEAAPSPQFCSKHQRWVNSILQQCPDECSEELLLQTTVSSSPPLFQSSSSTSTSQDLTPSDLISCPPDQQHAAQACEQANPGDKLTSGSPGSAMETSRREPLPQPSSSRDTLLPALLSPVVQLIDIASVRGINLTFKLHKATPNQFTMSSNKQAFSATSLDRFTSRNDAILQGTTKYSTFNQPETVAKTVLPETPQVQTAPVSQDASTSTRCQPPTVKSFSRQVVPESSVKHHPQTLNTTYFKKTPLCSTAVSTTSNSDSMAVRSDTSRIQRAQPRLSLRSHVMLLQSKLLQPYVSLSRLSNQKCHDLTMGRSSSKFVEPIARGSPDEDKEKRKFSEGDADSSFDPNTLYSSYSSNGDSEDSLSDPDYKPCIKKKILC